MPKGSNMNKAGGASFTFDTASMRAAAVTACAEAGLECLLLTQADLRLTLSKPGTGKKYPGLRYRSSAPGRPPAAQTGYLRDSWQTGQPRRVRTNRLVGWAIGSAVPYARILEFGGKRIFARPYLRPALRRILGKVGGIYKDKLRERMRPFNVKVASP